MGTGGGTRVRLLGRVSIEHGGVASSVGFPGRRSELVFAYLVAEHRRDVSRDELADALWPQQLPDAWAAALRGVVTDVRRVIEAAGLDPAEVIRRTGGGYRLQLPADAVVDLDVARAGLARARATLDGDPAGAAAEADLAAESARLPFLPRHEGEWVDGVRRELESILLESLELSARGHAASGDARAAAAAAARLVEADPYNDRAHRVRIEVLGAVGDPSAAMRAGEHCRATLGEVGVEPSAETQAALRRALESSPPAPATPGPAAAAAPASRLASLSVLVVDDHDFQRRTAVALLDRLGVGTLADAPDGTQALELLARSSPPDVIICDIDMPGMDGVEFIRNVAERHLASAVVIASGLDRSVLQAVEAVGEGYGLQVLGAVEKPLTARRLSELLAAYTPPRPVQEPGGPQLTDEELRATIDDGRLEVRFAPIVDLHVGAVTGVRAIAMLGDPAGDPPRPVAWPTNAETAVLLTDHVLSIACDHMRDLASAGADLGVWMPLGGNALADVAGADRLLAIVREREVDPRRTVFAIGERAVRRSTPAELDTLTRMRVKGFGICLEDFGGGHVSDDALGRIPLTAVAVTASLVRGAARDKARAAALEDALDAIRARDLPALARGCDDQEDFHLLVQVGCRLVDGPFIAEPLPGGRLADWALGWEAPSIVDAST